MRGRILADPGAMVQPGDPLMELEDPYLDARIAGLEAQQREVQLRLEAARVSDMVGAEMYRQQLAHVGAALDQERRRKADLVVRAGTAGRFVLPMAQGANPNANTIAMAPVPHVAGTASAVMATVTIAGGSVVGTVASEAFDGTVRPYVVYSFAYMVIAAAIQSSTMPISVV